MRHKCESYMLVIIFFLLAFLTFWKTPLTNLFSYFHFQNFILRRNVQSGQSADCRNGILAPPFPRINELWNWKSRLKLCRSNTYSTTCRNGLPNLKILDAVLLRLISFQKIDSYQKKYHVWLEWLTKFPLFIKKDHNYSSFANGRNNIITSWGCVSFKHLGAGSPTVRLILLMELLSKLAIDGVLTQATQCLLFFPSILTSHWLKDMGYKDFPVRARNHVAHSCTIFPCLIWVSKSR